MKLILLGDVHGCWDATNASVHAALKEHPDAKAVVQLGDLADGWPIKGGKLARWKPDFNLPIYVVDGNHENFDALEAGDTNPRLTWVERGHIVTWPGTSDTPFNGLKAMFFGGATSPDAIYHRVIGVTWWPQESITSRDVQRALNADVVNLDAMFCHERADLFKIPERWNLPSFPGNPGLSDRVALSLVVKHHMPRWYFHGHWHESDVDTFEVNDKTICVVACPVINNKSIKWTVFDGNEIWRNWK